MKYVKNCRKLIASIIDDIPAICKIFKLIESPL